MPKNQPPWSVRGVTLEARAKAAKAAARRRMTIGEWVTNALITVANDELGSGPAASAASRPADRASGGTLQVHAPGGDSQHLQAPAVPAELTRAVETLTRRIEEGDEREKTVGALVDRLDALVHSDNTVTEMPSRDAEIARQDRDLLAATERLVASERANEQRLTVLTSAVTALTSRFDGTGIPASSGATTTDLAGAIAPLTRAIEGLIVHRGGPPPTPLQAAYEADTMESAGLPSGTAIPERKPAAVLPVPVLDFEQLHEKAIDNTRRLFSDDAEDTPKNGLISRLFGA